MVAKKKIDYASLIEWIRKEMPVSAKRTREKIKSCNYVSYNFVINKLKKNHNVVSFRRYQKGTDKFELFFTHDERASEEGNTWAECTYGPLLDVDSMVATLERHGYEKKEEGSYCGLPKTYGVTDAGVLGSTVNWCEPCRKGDRNSLPESGAEEELAGCSDSIQQETQEECSRTMSIEKLYARVEAQYARDIETMGRERANWWRA